MDVTVEYSDEEPRELLKLKNEQWGLISKCPRISHGQQLIGW